MTTLGLPNAGKLLQKLCDPVWDGEGGWKQTTRPTNHWLDLINAKASMFSTKHFF